MAENNTVPVTAGAPESTPPVSAPAAPPSPEASPKPVNKSRRELMAELRSQLQGRADAPQPAVATPEPEPVAALPAGEDSGDSPDLSQNSSASDSGVAGESPDAGDDDPQAPEAEPNTAKILKGLKRWKTDAKEKRKEVSNLQAKVEALLAEKAELEERLAMRSQAPTPSANPLAELSDPADIQARAQTAEVRVQNAEDLLDVLNDDPDGVAAKVRSWGVQLKDETGAEDFSVPRVRDFLKTMRRAEQAVVKAAPERLAALQYEDQALAEVMETVPEMQEKASDVFQRVISTVKLYPGIKSSPGWPKMATMYALGQAEYERRAAAKAKGGTKAPAIRPAPSLPAVSRSLPARPTGQESLAAPSSGNRKDWTLYARGALKRTAAATG